MDGTLYVVATPIGNLEEMSPRAVSTLRSVAIIACEDTRETLKLCARFQIDTPLMSCHEHNEFFVADKIVEILKKGDDVALVSDAGYPVVSDPGSIVVRRCVESRIKINVVSGPCALINGYVGSGIKSDHFYFYGFLPHRRAERLKELEKLVRFEDALIFYEAPHRINETLEDILETFGDRKISIGRELTKVHEEFLRGTVSQILAKIKDLPLRGEMVIVAEGARLPDVATLSDLEILQMVNERIERGMSASEAIKDVAAAAKIHKNEVYRKFHRN